MRSYLSLKIIVIVLAGLADADAGTDIGRKWEVKAKHEAVKVAFDPRGSVGEQRLRASKEITLHEGITYAEGYEDRRKEIPLMTRDFFAPRSRATAVDTTESVEESYWKRLLTYESVGSMPTDSAAAVPTIPTMAPTGTVIQGTGAPLLIPNPTLSPTRITPTRSPTVPAAATALPVTPSLRPVALSSRPVAPTGSPIAPASLPAVPTPAPLSRVAQVIIPVSIARGAEFVDPTSYQSQSMAWLESADTASLSDARIIQRYSLAAIYYATNNVRTVFTDEAFGGVIFPWKTSTNWVTDANECDWALVVCDASGFVTILDLFNNVLTGEFPPEVVYLKDTLEILDLGSNVVFAEGDVINPYLGQLTAIKDLRYDETNFISDVGVPTEIGLLKKLEHYTCATSLYRGAINGAAFPSDMTALTFLEIEFNAYNSSIPSAIGNLPNLERFYARDSFISGDLSWMANMKSIIECWVDINPGLSGTIPSFIGGLSTLASFSVSQCSFTGSLPSEIAQLSDSMTRMFYNENELVGGVPVEWGSLTNLDILEVRDNQLTEALPVSVCALTFAGLIRLIADCEICPASSCCDSCVS